MRKLSPIVAAMFVTVVGQHAASADVWSSTTANPAVLTTFGGTYPFTAGIGYGPGTHLIPINDRSMVFQEPDSTVVAQHKLVVILHGHSAATTPLTMFADFQNLASSLGLHSIALDWDYSSDPADGEPKYNIEAVCGCWSLCHGLWAQMVAEGTYNADGIPPARLSVEARLGVVLNYLDTVRPGQGWRQFFNPLGPIVVVGQPPLPQWNKVVLVGLSRGTLPATWLAKYRQLDRLLVFAGPYDNLINPGATSLDDPRTPGADPSHPTSYGFGPAFGSGGLYMYCNAGPFSPYYIVDNSWLTAHEKMFSFSNTGDKTAPWKGDVGQGTLVNLTTLALPGMEFVDTAGSMAEKVGWNTSNAHDLRSHVGFCGTDATDPSHHESVLIGDCQNDHFSATALRKRIWKYMLPTP